MAYAEEASQRTKDFLPIQVLANLCETVNRVNIKQLNSYKLTRKLVSSMGYIDNDIKYETTYYHDNSLIDLYKAIGGRILIYSTEKHIIGFKVKNPPYAFKRYVKEKLQNFSVLETSGYIICERKC